MHSDARWQRRNAWLTIVALGAAVALAAAVRAGATARLDEEITRLLTLHQSAFADGMASVLAFVFSVDVSALLMLVIAGFLWRRARWHAVALVAVFALTIVLELELKRWLQQPLGQIEQQFHAWVTHLRPGVNLNQLVLQPLWRHITRGRTGSPGVRPSDFGLRSGIMPAHAAAQGLRSGPAELLSSPKMQRVMQGLRDRADVIIYDSPPSVAVADAPIISSHVDAVLVVIDSRKTRLNAVRTAIDHLSRSRTRILGAVLNKVSERGRGYKYYYYYAHASDGYNSSSPETPPENVAASTR